MAKKEPHHDGRLAWAYVPIEHPDLTGWQVSFDGSRPVSVQGRCPACHSDNGDDNAWGPPLPEAEFKTRGVTRPNLRTVDPDDRGSIGAACFCGHEHGKAGASGCGRIWSVPVPSAGDDG